ncbi:hypothetical protein BJ742DRAFT_773264 [Cladochytrium replicatum]|nr:hypothetical protein BJ742DRAFT_773264 [Cladochytrium replicatum]
MQPQHMRNPLLHFWQPARTFFTERKDPNKTATCIKAKYEDTGLLEQLEFAEDSDDRDLSSTGIYDRTSPSLSLVETFAREEVDSLDVVTTLHLEAHRAMGSTVDDEFYTVVATMVAQSLNKVEEKGRKLRPRFMVDRLPWNSNPCSPPRNSSSSTTTMSPSSPCSHATELHQLATSRSNPMSRPLRVPRALTGLPRRRPIGVQGIY